MRKGLLIFLGGILIILLVGALGFVVWAGSTAEPMPEALAALESDERVQVQLEPWLIFKPQNIEGDPAAGLIFYPGGRVDPRAYAPAARAIAEADYLVVIVPMPLNLAVFGLNLADDVISAFPGVDLWAIGGHSLGGAMASRYVLENPDGPEGLFLWASFPAGSDDLSDRDLAVSSAYGTLDGLATPQEVRSSAPLLPARTHWVEIKGGNHAQFGWYGPQTGDNPATISRFEQQRIAVEAILAILEEIMQGVEK